MEIISCVIFVGCGVHQLENGEVNYVVNPELNEIVAVYKCNPLYYLNAVASRVCNITGGNYLWIGKLPACHSKCKALYLSHFFYPLLE